MSAMQNNDQNVLMIRKNGISIMEKNGEPCDCMEAILEGLRLVLDGKRFLEVLGTRLDQKKGSNYARIWISVCDFSLEFLNLVLLSQRFFRHVSCIQGLYMYP